jgi:hypothetical protein
VRMRHDRAVIASGVIDERVEQARREESAIAGLLERVPQALGQVVAGGRVEQEFHAQTTVEGQEIDVADAHVLCFIDEQHGTEESGLDMREPGVAKGFRPGPAIVRTEGHAEEVPDLAVEIRQSGLWAREDADHDIPQSREPCREQAQGDRQRRYVRVTRFAQRG